MGDEVLDGPHMVGLFLGERQGFTHQPGNTLPQSLVKAPDVIRCPSLFHDDLVLLGWNHTLVDRILIRIERRLFTVLPWQVSPQLPRTGATAVAHVKRDDLTCGPVHRQPQPSLARLLLDEGTHLIGFSLYKSHHHRARTAWKLDMQML